MAMSTEKGRTSDFHICRVAEFAVCKAPCGQLQEPEVWELLKDLEEAAKEHDTG